MKGIKWMRYIKEICIVQNIYVYRNSITASSSVTATAVQIAIIRCIIHQIKYISPHRVFWCDSFIFIFVTFACLKFTVWISHVYLSTTIGFLIPCNYEIRQWMVRLVDHFFLLLLFDSLLEIVVQIHTRTHPNINFDHLRYYRFISGIGWVGVLYTVYAMYNVHLFAVSLLPFELYIYWPNMRAN